ncbi:hypothetical protein HYU11_01680 [Candidatus Woesearchaeota archaeon]|nr:hypothetical protein [Candidatus Woesearchaeota archaeon]
MAVAESGLVIVPALFFGAIISLAELFFVHADERGMGWLGHGLHAIPATMAFTFATMNVPFILQYLNQTVTVTWQIEMGVIAFVSIIAMLKVSAAAAIIGRVGEKFHHTLMIGGLMFVSPYIWKAMGPALTNMLPFLAYEIF